MGIVYRKERGLLQIIPLTIKTRAVTFGRESFNLDGCHVSGSNLPTIVITETLDAACARWLAQHAHVVRAQHNQPQDLARHLPTAQGLVVRTYTQVDRELLDKTPHLRVVAAPASA